MCICIIFIFVGEEEAGMNWDWKNETRLERIMDDM